MECFLLQELWLINMRYFLVIIFLIIPFFLYSNLGSVDVVGYEIPKSRVVGTVFSIPFLEGDNSSGSVVYAVDENEIQASIPNYFVNDDDMKEITAYVAPLDKVAVDVITSDELEESKSIELSSEFRDVVIPDTNLAGMWWLYDGEEDSDEFYKSGYCVEIQGSRVCYFYVYMDTLFLKYYLHERNWKLRKPVGCFIIEQLLSWNKRALADASLRPDMECQN